MAVRLARASTLLVDFIIRIIFQLVAHGHNTAETSVSIVLGAANLVVELHSRELGHACGKVA